MRQINIHQAKTHLSQLIEDAVKGEEIIIAKAGKAMVRLTAIETLPPRKKGLLKGKIRISDDFDAPLPKQILESFEGNI